MFAECRFSCYESVAPPHGNFGIRCSEIDGRYRVVDPLVVRDHPPGREVPDDVPSAIVGQELLGEERQVAVIEVVLAAAVHRGDEYQVGRRASHSSRS